MLYQYISEPSCHRLEILSFKITSALGMRLSTSDGILKSRGNRKSWENGTQKSMVVRSRDSGVGLGSDPRSPFGKLSKLTMALFLHQ